MAGNGLVQRAAELGEFALASNEPFTGFITLAFRSPQDAYRRSSDFFFSQLPPLKVSTLSYQNGGRAEICRKKHPAPGNIKRAQSLSPHRDVSLPHSSLISQNAADKVFEKGQGTTGERMRLHRRVGRAKLIGYRSEQKNHR